MYGAQYILKFCFWVEVCSYEKLTKLELEGTIRILLFLLFLESYYVHNVIVQGLC